MTTGHPRLLAMTKRCIRNGGDCPCTNFCKAGEAISQELYRMDQQKQTEGKQELEAALKKVR